MNPEPQILDFVKAMSSAERLRVIGALVRGRATQAEIAEQLHVSVRDVFNHLASGALGSGESGFCNAPPITWGRAARDVNLP